MDRRRAPRRRWRACRIGSDRIGIGSDQKVPDGDWKTAQDRKRSGGSSLDQKDLEGIGLGGDRKGPEGVGRSEEE